MQDSRIRTVTPEDGLPAHFRRVVSFHPRGGRLNDVQRRAWTEHAESWYLDPEDYGPENPFDGDRAFGRSAPLVIEIGSGMGESTAAMAVARPDINLMAVEVYKPGVAQTFHHLARAGASNVRVMRGDGVQILTELIAPGSLAEAWLFFPDPWPKTKHLKRRLVTPPFTELVASRLRKGGTFRLATDWAPYAEQMLAVGSTTKGLRNAYPGWAARPDFRPRTRFERRGIAAGREIFDLEFTRR
ncbi:tRNA (guanine-N7-)-methyltransferase [Nakamurella panacisegetis]|uniref:tRNA (guanine-N(7)-)-methyltransferase n=1 Tax=Nakamurella panacisegetis TaxID=1090615 RepID=A0A1H0MB39_9ACTN|nr:tRNA (guanosine(46)-N7)-methyltransferase TrmB [Nakamurella panacisegetis]SDO77340.1 tRNA (guanine-N7-)-methyltransferase [Nakamurella panacisegetis]